MSLPWAEAIPLHLAPGELRLGDATTAFAAPADLPAALERLAAARSLRGRRLELLLDDAYVHYLLLDWPAGVNTDEERGAYVRFRFQQLCGAACPAQVHAWENARPDRKVLASACDAALLAQVADWARLQRARLAGARGAWLDAYNRHARGMTGQTGAFGLWRGGRCTLGVWQAGDWQALRSFAADGAAAVADELARIAAALGLAKGLCHLSGLPGGGNWPDGWRRVDVEAAP
ncbi:MAG: hypothetical protein KF778_02730 [Rhodocyclaceae bacterium]|nr:hypothetical protein [Rhodocyclaceae bacterium]MBX3667292.1 hypothetical protein [Rhodocyclaceae bacterium]